MRFKLLRYILVFMLFLAHFIRAEEVIVVVDPIKMSTPQTFKFEAEPGQKQTRIVTLTNPTNTTLKIDIIPRYRYAGNFSSVSGTLTLEPEGIGSIEIVYERPKDQDLLDDISVRYNVSTVKNGDENTSDNWQFIWRLVGESLLIPNDIIKEAPSLETHGAREETENISISSPTPTKIPLPSGSSLSKNQGTDNIFLYWGLFFVDLSYPGPMKYVSGSFLFIKSISNGVDITDEIAPFLESAKSSVSGLLLSPIAQSIESSSSPPPPTPTPIYALTPQQVLDNVLKKGKQFIQRIIDQIELAYAFFSGIGITLIAIVVFRRLRTMVFGSSSTQKKQKGTSMNNEQNKQRPQTGPHPNRLASIIGIEEDHGQSMNRTNPIERYKNYITKSLSIIQNLFASEEVLHEHAVLHNIMNELSSAEQIVIQNIPENIGCMSTSEKLSLQESGKRVNNALSLFKDLEPVFQTDREYRELKSQLNLAYTFINPESENDIETAGSSRNSSDELKNALKEILGVDEPGAILEAVERLKVLEPLPEQLEENQKQHGLKDEQIQTLQETLHRLREEKGNVEEESRRQYRELKEIQSQLSYAQHNIEGYDDKIRLQKKEYEDRQKSIQARFTSTENELRDRQRELSSTKSQVYSLNNELNILKGGLERLSGEFEYFRQHSSEELKRIEHERDDLREQVNDLRKQLAREQNIRESKEKELKQKDIELQEMVQRIDVLQQRLEEFNYQYIVRMKRLLNSLQRGILHLLEGMDENSRFRQILDAILLGSNNKGGLKAALRKLLETERSYSGKQEFFEKYFVRYFLESENYAGFLDDFFRLCIYAKTEDVREQLLKDGLDFESLNILYYEVRTALRDEFDLQFSEVILFKEQFDPSKYKPVYHDELQQLHPGLKKKLQELPLNRIYDIFKVGVDSEAFNLHRQPVVVPYQKV